MTQHSMYTYQLPIQYVWVVVQQCRWLKTKGRTCDTSWWHGKGNQRNIQAKDARSLKKLTKEGGGGWTLIPNTLSSPTCLCRLSYCHSWTFSSGIIMVVLFMDGILFVKWMSPGFSEWVLINHLVAAISLFTMCWVMMAHKDMLHTVSWISG